MKISVITATYNSARTLRDTLESVLLQTYNNIEHIIVDGNSSDATMDIVREYEPRYQAAGKQLRYLTEQDNGLYDAMNKGLCMAEGDVVGLLNSDDFFTSENVLQRVAEEFDTNSDALDAVYGDVHYVHPNNLRRCIRYYSSRKFTRKSMRMGFMPAHPSFYCRREVFKKYGMYDIDFKVAADFEHMLRLIYIHNINIRYIPMDFVTMRTGGASTSGLKSHCLIFADHRRAYRKNNVDSNCFLEACRYAIKVYEICRDNIS